jgi:pimeloyl-ACP methyl ester carboxylesterase
LSKRRANRQQSLRRTAWFNTQFRDVERLRQVVPGWVDLLQSWHAPLGNDHWQSLLTQIATLFWTPLHYTAEDFAKITAPALILSGDRDTLIPLEQQVEMYRLIPDAELAILPGADHLGATRRVDLFTHIVSDFFERHPAHARPLRPSSSSPTQAVRGSR